MPELTALFAVCGCRYNLLVTGPQRLSGTVSFQRTATCVEHAPPRERDMPVGEGSRARVCGTCGTIYDEDYCPTCELEC